MSMNRSVFDEDECAAAVACRRTRLRTLKSEFPETTVIVFFSVDCLDQGCNTGLRRRR